MTEQPEDRSGPAAAGLRLAVGTLTVVPVPPGRVDRSAAAVAMALAPAVGAVLGAVCGALLVGLGALGLPAGMAAGLTVAAGALLTRGLHLDGLADTVDALGSYRRGQAGLQVMKKPDIGPFGVAAIVLTLLVQAAALTALVGHRWPVVVATVAVAGAAARLAVPIACRRGVPAARPEGLGALVAATVPTPVVALAAVAVGVLAMTAVPDRAWQGPVAVAAAGCAAVLLVRHAVGRFGGITGDVIGAAVEVAGTVAYVVLLAGR